MYHDKIRRLEISLEEQNLKINKLKSENTYSTQELTALTEQRNQTLRDLSSLRRLQHEEDYERVRFDDDR